MLSAYFFSQDGICNFDLIKHINIFPDSMYFERMGINIQDKEDQSGESINDIPTGEQDYLVLPDGTRAKINIKGDIP